VPDNKPIGNSDWIIEYGLVELDADGNQIPLTDRVECDYDQCGDGATFYYRHQCCNHVTLTCDLHKNMTITHLVRAQERGEVMTCAFCKKHKIPTMLITRPQPLRLTS